MRYAKEADKKVFCLKASLAKRKKNTKNMELKTSLTCNRIIAIMLFKMPMIILHKSTLSCGIRMMFVTRSWIKQTNDFRWLGGANYFLQKKENTGLS